MHGLPGDTQKTAEEGIRTASMNHGQKLKKENKKATGDFLPLVKRVQARLNMWVSEASDQE